MERYDNLDGLRVISCIGVIGMHIKANGNYQINGWIWDHLIPSFTLLVYLFLIISGFGMFCGYYENFKNGSVNLNTFYEKRYRKIGPFFIFLIVIDVLVERSASCLIEGLTEATLVFGLLPNNTPSVIGVGWTLGVIFLFYILFPFVVFLCWTRKRAWLSFFAACILTIFCNVYFFSEKFVVEGFVPRHNFLYCAPYFIGGGIIYLYRNEIKNIVLQFRWIWLIICIIITAVYYRMPDSIVGHIDSGVYLQFVFLPWLAYAISVKSRILSNKFVHYLSSISLELYLAQMVLFRAVEKAKCLYLFGAGWISFITVWVIVMIGLVIFIELYKYMSQFIKRKLSLFKYNKST